MTIIIEYRNPSLAHCDVTVFINHANTGTLRLRQEEIVSFQQILAGGCVRGLDTFLARGTPQPPGVSADWTPPPLEVR